MNKLECKQITIYANETATVFNDNPERCHTYKGITESSKARLEKLCGGEYYTFIVFGYEGPRFVISRLREAVQ